MSDTPQTDSYEREDNDGYLYVSADFARTLERKLIAAKADLVSVITRRTKDLDSLRADVDRLKRGDFTPEEFQNLCHKFSEHDREAFCKGCAEYQRMLFGTADVDMVRKILADLMPFVLEDYWERWATPDFKAAVEAANKAIE